MDNAAKTTRTRSEDPSLRAIDNVALGEAFMAWIDALRAEGGQWCRPAASIDTAPAEEARAKLSMILEARRLRGWR